MADALESFALSQMTEGNPADLGYPIALPLELALGDKPVKEIFEDYGLSREDFDRLSHDVVFVSEVKRFREELAKDGMSFKLKARLQADEMLKRAWVMIHDPTTPASVKADLLKSIVRWAGLEQRPTGTAADVENASGPAFQINIIMGDA